MPARPTITHHRYPKDEVKKPVDFKKASPVTKLDVAIITAAEQQTMNYYMNQCGFYETDLGRRLYQEIAMVEEQHVSQYGSLMDVKQSWLEGWLCHEYTECYVYYSCFKDETDKHVKKIWEMCLLQEITHLHKACECLEKYGKRIGKRLSPTAISPNFLRLNPQRITCAMSLRIRCATRRTERATFQSTTLTTMRSFSPIKRLSTQTKR